MEFVCAKCDTVKVKDYHAMHERMPTCADNSEPKINKSGQRSNGPEPNLNHIHAAHRRMVVLNNHPSASSTSASMLKICWNLSICYTFNEF